jgi:hypothetical protein
MSWQLHPTPGFEGAAAWYWGDSAQRQEVDVADREYDVRAELLKNLMSKVKDDPFPSHTMLDIIEQLLTPDDVSDYAQVLMSKVADEQFPSITMLRRIQGVSGA